jgi:exopolysaccharide biosynthesis polyprenyl glycosylphosphotransferase
MRSAFWLRSQADRDYRQIALRPEQSDRGVYLSISHPTNFSTTECGKPVRSFPGLPFQGNDRNVLMVGSNQRAVAVADKLIGKSGLGYQLTGFVDDHWDFDGAPPHYKEMLVGGTKKIAELLRDLALDDVFIALPIDSNHQLVQEIVDLCQVQGISVISEARNCKVESLNVFPVSAGLTIVSLYDCSRDKWRDSIKRILDIIVSATALIMLLPVLACIALGIKLTSPGPVIFSQERLGLGKRLFQVFKFRTMVSDAESLMVKLEHLNESAGPNFKLKNDPRVTPIGSILRKTSLDELPQLFNVLLGDMSLVGPRPIVMRDYRGISEDWHRRRFSVKPGITCLWQISGRNAVTFDRWMELDRDYIDGWSLRLDIKILVKTIPAVLRGSGAM